MSKTIELVSKTNHRLTYARLITLQEAIEMNIEIPSCYITKEDSRDLIGVLLWDHTIRKYTYIPIEYNDKVLVSRKDI